MRSSLAALACVLACACAKAPDATTKPKASAEGAAPSGLDAGGADGGRFGLPMPQVYPRFVWDAAAADAAPRDEHGR
jgi:hypothetical protein